MKFILLIFLFLLCACSPRWISPVQKAPDEFQQLLAQPALSDAHVGVLVCEAETGTVIYKHHADKLFMPASNMKLFTTAAALYQLGADYRFCTRLVLNGTQLDSVFYGNVILVGGGDPTFCRHYQTDDNAVFQRLIELVDSRGIREIHGNILSDVSLFDGQLLGLGWSWENQPFRFSAPICPLSCYENCVRVILTANHFQQSPLISISPDYPDIFIQNDVQVSEATCANSVMFTRHESHIRFSGDLPVGSSDTSFCTIPFPADFCKQVFRAELVSAGIRVKNVDSLPTACAAFDTCQHYSMPLKDIIAHINTDSRNLDAELLFRTMGYERFGVGNDKHSICAVNEFLTSVGIDTTGIRLADGSGLSRKNLLSPTAIVKLLLWMYHSPDANVFQNSLARAGTNGTLFKYVTLQGKMLAKTGTLDAVKCLSGYLKTHSGKTLIFSIMMNHYTASHAEVVAVQQKICEYLLTIE